jgi:ADP-ribose pyrophosphatase YjhB (NUDIX family)
MEQFESWPYRDGAGKTLADYPRPSVAVDAALLTVVPGEECLSVLQVQRAEGPGGNPPAGWGLPGTFLHQGELLLDAVQRCLREKAGVDGTRPRQLHVFDKPDRDDRGWVLSVAHMDVVRPELLSGRIKEKTRIVPADDLGILPYDHTEIIRQAVQTVRVSYQLAPDPERLLAEPFTILQLRLMHEAVVGRPFQRDTFRRLMEPQLAGTGRTTAGARGRPAELFRLKQH